jgi:hypothetical protein
MKATKNPVLELAQIFKGNEFTIQTPRKTRGKPSVEINKNGKRYLITFSLKKLVSEQKFLGLYPSAVNLPNANNLKVGDYGLLLSGEVVQIGE